MINPLTAGGKSSEFKAMLLAVALVLATGFDSPAFSLDTELVKWVLGPIMAYIASRMYVKGEHEKAAAKIAAVPGAS